MGKQYPNGEYFHIEFEEGLWGLKSKNTSGWGKKNKEVTEKLKHLLEEANCISVTSGEPVVIGWRRSGFGMYYYNIFSDTSSVHKHSCYEDGCNYLQYSPKVVFEYQGGAVGSQCFRD